jgi:hypothetical protein
MHAVGVPNTQRRCRQRDRRRASRRTQAQTLQLAALKMPSGPHCVGTGTGTGVPGKGPGRRASDCPTRTIEPAGSIPGLVPLLLVVRTCPTSGGYQGEWWSARERDLGKAVGGNGGPWKCATTKDGWLPAAKDPLTHQLQNVPRGRGQTTVVAQKTHTRNGRESEQRGARPTARGRDSDCGHEKTWATWPTSM